MPSESLAVCAAPMLDPTNPHANAKNPSSPASLFFQCTVNVSLLDGITLGRVKLELLDTAKTQNFNLQIRAPLGSDHLLHS
jgi:hypothetical protein